jgi:type IV secretory pathway VirB9-like protein
MNRAAVLAALIAAAPLAACAGDPQPKIVQSTTADQEIRMSAGLATQIELPKGERVVNVTVGNPRATRSG